MVSEITRGLIQKFFGICLRDGVFYKYALPIAGPWAEIISELFFSNVFFKKHAAFFDGVVADSRCRVPDGTPQSRNRPAGLKETDFMATPFCEYV